MNDNSNDSAMEIIAQVLEEMKTAMGSDFSCKRQALFTL